MEFKAELPLSNILYSGDMARNTISNLTNIIFDIELGNHIRDKVSLPVITLSGAGNIERLSEVFEKTVVEPALAGGNFHREEIPIEAKREHMREEE